MAGTTNRTTLELSISAMAFYDERHGLTVYVDNRDIGRIPPDGRLRIVGIPGQPSHKHQPTKQEREEKRILLLATLSQIPQWRYDYRKLASCCGLSVNTIRKYVQDAERQYEQQRASLPRDEQEDGED
jgi:hypothetical protein